MGRCRAFMYRPVAGGAQLSAPRGFGYVASSVLLVAAAQLLLKIAALQLGDVVAQPQQLFALAALLPLCAGLVAYAISMLCWLRALEQLPLGRIYPMLALSYPLVYVGAMYLPLLHESLSATRLAGVALIVVGVVLLAPAERGAEYPDNQRA